jgi:hypothetical protein
MGNALHMDACKRGVMMSNASHLHPDTGGVMKSNGLQLPACTLAGQFSPYRNVEKRTQSGTPSRGVTAGIFAHSRSGALREITKSTF